MPRRTRLLDGFISPATRDFFGRALARKDLSPLARAVEALHGYLYLRAPVFYIGVALGRHPASRRLLAPIYRLGRLGGLYDVYYTPYGITETATASQVLCLGRGTSVARNPFILGDAVPPMMEPIAGDKSMTKGAAFYARGFTAINPHPQSQLGCALIDVINLK